MTHSHTPDLMPVLSRGKHRSPRKGACFMELASYLAGEKWSDHPACTHPLLAALARDVNDHVRDETRTSLAVLIPEVVGLRGDDPRVDAWIARECALTALPIASAERQGVAAVGLLRCERALNALTGQSRQHLSPRAAAALDDAPHARDWARGFTALGWGNAGSFSRRSAPAIVHSAVSGISSAVVADSDAALVDLLRRNIELCQDWFHHEVAPIGADAWRGLVELTAR
jgi:hypothetical protein